nr:protein argonaute-4 [Parasteatoda tepidariorum]
MAKTNRKGMNQNYPVGHPSYLQASSHSPKPNDKNTRQPADLNNDTKISSSKKNERQADDNLRTSSSKGVVEVPVSTKTSGNVTVPRSSTISAAQSETADATNDEKSRDDISNGRQITRGLPPKLPPGILGRRIRLVSNLYTISLLPDGKIFHYDVKIIKWKIDEATDLDDETEKNKKYGVKNTRLNREVIENMLANNTHLRNSYAVYDGKYNLYAPSPLQVKFPYETKVFLENENKNPEEKRGFLVVMNPVQKKNGMEENSCAINLSVLHELYQGKLSDVDDVQEALVALETVFRHTPSLRYVPIGRNFYHPDIGGMHPLSGGIQIWFGYHQSTRLGQWNLTVNLNTSATTFFNKQNLIEYVGKSYDIRHELSETAIERLAGELKNVKIETGHLGYKARRCIIDVTMQSARSLKFEIETKSGGTEIVSVLQYFRDTHNINLAYPHLPCVQVKPKKRRIYLPLELCIIPEGEHSKKELSIEDKRQMIQYTADPPVKKFNKISDIRNRWADYNNDKYLNNFGVKVEDKAISVNGRVLEAPTLNYNKNRTVKPATGSWNIKGLEFYDGAHISTWALLSLAPEKWCGYRDLERFSQELKIIGKNAGLNMGNPDSIKILRGYDDYEKIHNAKEELKCLQRKRVQLTVVLIPNKDKFLYNNVKQVAEIELGLLTQCIDSNNAKKCNASVLSNLCIKINAKMGGINHILTQREIPQIMAKPVIIMGADVCHAGITDKTGVSVASLTASLDMLLSRFAVICRLQKNEKLKKKSVENILELKDMVKTLLKAFYAHTKGQKPEKIIFFRDGVSDTQFQDIKKKEVNAIREACVEIQEGYQPAITFITVQKRHHVRFRPEDFKDGVGKEGNVPPGTVVDTGIVHPVHSDFFLCSHQGLKGTSKPAHYTVLEDDNKFTADDLQKLTYCSCNISFRCSKTLSIPVPVHYADLAAYRTRSRLSTLSEDLKKRQAKSGKILKEFLDATELSGSIKNSMYFV